MAADVIGDAVEVDDPLMDAGMDWGHRGRGGGKELGVELKQYGETDWTIENH